MGERQQKVRETKAKRNAKLLVGYLHAELRRHYPPRSSNDSSEPVLVSSQPASPLHSTSSNILDWP